MLLTLARRTWVLSPDVRAFGSSRSAPHKGGTVLRWLGMAGFFVNSRGTTFMIDPVLWDFDMPIAPQAVPRLDAVLVTHGDNDTSARTRRAWDIALRAGIGPATYRLGGGCSIH